MTTRAELIEQVAKIIAPPFTYSDGTADQDWTLWLEEAEQIVDLSEAATASEGWLTERFSRIIAGPDQHGGQDDETWREWLAEAEQIVDLLRPEEDDA